MKICCSQEYYDKVVQYAKSINDKTLENCLERLKQWEKNENRPCEIELYYDHAPYSFTLLRPCALFVRILRTLSGREYRHCRRTAVSWKSRRILCRHHGTFPRMEHT